MSEKKLPDWWPKCNRDVSPRIAHGWDCASEAIFDAMQANNVLAAANFHERLVDAVAECMSAQKAILAYRVRQDKDYEPPKLFTEWMNKTEQLLAEIKEAQG